MLKNCTPSYHDRMSYQELHTINNRATPSQMSDYKLALLLHILINLEILSKDWIDINFQQNLNSRNTTSKCFKTNRYKIGENIICNRLPSINGKKQLEWISESFDSFKLICKQALLTPWWLDRLALIDSAGVWKCVYDYFCIPLTPMVLTMTHHIG